MNWLPALLAALFSVACAVGVWRASPLRRALVGQVAAAERKLGVVHSGSLIARAVQAIGSLLAHGEGGSNRSGHVHSMSGLATRDVLFQQMIDERSGTLIVLALRDYDRLCTFDPALGERVLSAIVARLRAMLQSSRTIVQIDRAHLAIWLGPEVSEASAAAEAQAMTYALSDRLVDGDREILPEIVLRSAPFDAAREDPEAALSSIISAFAVSLANHAVVYADLAAHTREQFAMEQDLRQAIARGELSMAFQPLIDADKGRICGAEALIRWEHHARGTIPPARFIPAMEAAGITHDISLWALNHALRELRGWQSAGLEGLRVAVNLSGRDLEVEALPLLIERTLARHGLAPAALEIELTETVALADGDRAARLCSAMRAMGVAIAIDDFGTGYASLGALRSLTFDKLKIDRSFITNVEQRRDSQAICNAMLALGCGLGIQVLAEGVETAAEYAWLRQRGCRFFQGYYFARPLSSADFLAQVRDPAQLVDGLIRSPAVSFERLRA